ncbi:MAG: pyridoxal-phosphate dependent enzyme [Chitinophagaceae bacterium]|nr:pyridoxal-phosphate dependent enzyme [Chitinophagaceae bacterium]
MPTAFSSIVDLAAADIHPLKGPFFEQAGVQMDVLRLDKIHSIISGNKWFKIKHDLELAIVEQKPGIISFGGAYSNHLVALAEACRVAGIRSAAIIRGEEPTARATTIEQLRSAGMELHFVSREQYQQKKQLKELFEKTYAGFHWVDEGGRGENGIKGAAEILELHQTNYYTHFCCAIGTGTMMTGLLRAAQPNQTVVGIPVLKLGDEMNELLGTIQQNANASYKIYPEFEEGGYAKKNDGLINFMNELYADHNIPTDFVYTAKLFKAILALIESRKIPKGSKLLLIHSGGLQGNRSLKAGTLSY